MYVKKAGEGATMVSPTGGISGASAGASEGGYDQPLSPQTIAFLENETPAERDTRMQGISDLISMVVPGGMITKALGGAGLTGIGAIANAFGGTQAPAPVEDAVGRSVSEINNSTESSPGGGAFGGAGYEGGMFSGAQSGDVGFAKGGISHLGDYSDGGRLLRGPGDGISDSIPAMIGKKRPARLADGEFVVPARIVSELGNGSTEAGARKLYAMMDRVQKARKKTVGKGKVAANSRSAKYLPA
jgi:hypothetical protein